MRLRNIVIGGALLSIVVGFTLGKTVVADSPAPGSSSDPVVSKSYVDKALQDRIKELETAVADLTVKSQALQTALNELQAKVNKTPVRTTPATPGTSTPSTPTTPAAPPQNNTSVIGKTASVTGSTSVNIRSGPATSYSVVTKVNSGDIMVIQQVKDSWYQVKLSDGKTGWVASWVVEVK
ncbi:MAG: SH3 domain-containing protein [Bacillota bacterium]|uniref:SH3 domain-containing protein n=1 Tax=Thermanaerosceptrum fracticalcis TaxID=1712410 RepID=A0A7G6E4H7_THEFR|nr:SH3 domain-containing protein [Thermanaerosceptrum fracticalcis]QNB46981.1 SH3 domain-containing protein [Thermanaerosceptrum fracticalcis]